MPTRETTRRALLGAVVAGVAGAGTLSPASSYLRRFAPFSGTVPGAATHEVPDEVESPYGDAEVTYDGYGVPHVSAGDERACYFAVGFVQAADRLFQMELQRRSMRGTLSEVVGEATLDSDLFHRRMDFVGAAEATWEGVEGTDTGPLVEAYVEGVNRYVSGEHLPLEFGLLEFEPAPWTAVDSMLMEKQISWGLTGSFRTLRQDVLRGTLDGDLYEELYPETMDHDSPIIRRGRTGGEEVAEVGGGPHPAGGGSPSVGAADTALVDWLSQFEPPPGIGSNSWVVGGEHTDSGLPIVCNDPHLSLMVPPVWYEMDLETEETAVRGVTFPGVPFVVIGENDAGAWGFTNVGADVLDVYSYETGEGQYRYEDEWREYDERTETVPVSGGDDREVRVRKTVHGPVLEREGREVAVAWTGLTATRTTVAIHRYAHSDGMADVLDATRDFDVPTQNLVYADRDGNTLYYVTGRLPDRRIDSEARGASEGSSGGVPRDGEHVRGDRIFDGSAGEAEWEGFTPYGESTWEGFVPFEEKPHVLNPDLLATANQRVVDDPSYYIGESFAPPFRGGRIYDRLDRAVEVGEAIDPAFMRDLQSDTHDERAAMLVPAIVDASAGRSGQDLSGAAGEAVERLADWDYRMDRDSRAALDFVFVLDAYREALFSEAFEAMDLDEGYWPGDWTVVTMEADSPWFDHIGRDRAALLLDAVESAVTTIDEEGYEVYGDYNRIALTHPFGLEFLAYPDLPADGSPASVMNFRVESDAGSSWRMVAPLGDEESGGIVPGGNSGDYFSPHYHDQLRMWADGEYKPLGRPADGEPDVVFGGE